LTRSAPIRASTIFCAASAWRNDLRSIAAPLLALAVLFCSLQLLAQTQPSSEVAQLMQSGAAAMRQGKPADAEEFFRKAASAAPALPDAFLGLGMADLREGKMEDAERALAKAVELNPETPGAHMFLGIAQFQMNKLDAATASLKEELIRQPDNVEVLTWLGIAELGAGHADQAVGALDRAAQLSPKDPNVLDYRGRAHSLVAQESYRALTALDPDSWRVHRALGEVSSESKDWSTAAAEYQKAIDRQPNNSDLYEALGDADQRLRRLDDAARAYQTELKLSPHNAVALFNLGKMQVERGDPQRGVVLLRQAAEVSAPSAQISVYLGRGLADTAHPQEAVTWLEKSLAQNPSQLIQESAYFQLARVYRTLNRNADAERAAGELKRLKESAVPSASGSDDPQ
jgi:tetratricopeptide (TPR) repeat protein